MLQGPARLVPQAPKGDTILQCQVWTGLWDGLRSPLLSSSMAAALPPHCTPSPCQTLPVAGLSGTLSPCSISHVGPMSESSPASSGSVKSQEKTLLASEQEEAR